MLTGQALIQRIFLRINYRAMDTRLFVPHIGYTVNCFSSDNIAACSTPRLFREGGNPYAIWLQIIFYVGRVTFQLFSINLAGHDFASIHLPRTCLLPSLSDRHG